MIEMLTRLKQAMVLTRRQRRQVDRNTKLIQRMHQLAIVMDEDVDIVAERFKAFLGQVTVPWAIVYLPAYARALKGIKDPWFYGDSADTEERET